MMQKIDSLAMETMGTWLEWRSSMPNFDNMPISAGIEDNKLFLEHKQKRWIYITEK